jgi:ribosomal protein S21
LPRPAPNTEALAQSDTTGIVRGAATIGRLHRACPLSWPFIASTHGSPYRKDYTLQVFVRDNNVDQALRVLKKKMQREGVFREMRQRRSYERPSERKNREKSEAIRRARKLARKKA